MSNGTISVRYAKALLEYADERHTSGIVYAEMKTLKDVMRRVPELLTTLLDPTLLFESKLSVLMIAVGGESSKVSEETERFLSLILKNGREDILLFMASSYISIYRESKGILFTKLTTATPVDDAFVKRFEDIIHSTADGTVEWEKNIDPNIEGGFVLQVDDRRLDASIAGQFRRVEKELIDKNKRII